MTCTDCGALHLRHRRGPDIRARLRARQDCVRRLDGTQDVGPTNLPDLAGPPNDYAFLQIASQVMNKRRVNIQDVTGGAVLGVAPRAGTNVTDIAYPSGIDDSPITCTAKLTRTGGYPTFNCNGYPAGTSGSPFLVEHPGRPNVVVGLVGGRHQGGC